MLRLYDDVPGRTADRPVDNRRRRQPVLATVAGMGERRAVRAAAVLWCTAAVVVLVGCTPESEPTPLPLPTATGFASDAEAFAAAEATYRAYVDALNEVDLADPATFHALYTLTTGEGRDSARSEFQQMHMDGWTVRGESKVTLVKSLGRVHAQIQLAVCVDVSNVELTDVEGRSMVSPERAAVQSLLVTLEEAQTSTGWLISSFAGREGEPLCS